MKEWCRLRSTGRMKWMRQTTTKITRLMTRTSNTPENEDDDEEELSQEEIQDPDFNIEEYGSRVVGTARIQVHIVSSG